MAVHDMPHAPTDTRTRRRQPWDFALMVTTVVLLAGLGLQSFVGTLYSWWAYRTQPAWEMTGYGSFVATMNAVAAPMLLGLVIVMGLCVPKRLFSHRTLVAVSAALLGLGAVVGVVSGRPAAGLAAYLSAAGLIQVAVVALTVKGAGRLAYLREGTLVRVGSALLHLGFIVFALTVVALQRSALMLPVFWSATALTVGGSLLAFYARQHVEPAEPVAPDESPEPPSEDAPGGAAPSEASPRALG